MGMWRKGRAAGLGPVSCVGSSPTFPTKQTEMYMPWLTQEQIEYVYGPETDAITGRKIHLDIVPGATVEEAIEEMKRVVKDWPAWPTTDK